MSSELPADAGRSGEAADAGQEIRAWGSRPARLGPVTVIFGAVAGGILTVLAGSEPGWLLGLCVVIATAAGTSAVRRTAAYVVIPVPVLAYFLVAVIAGLIHDRSVDTTRAILFVNAVQWIASGFFWMFLSTVIAIAITVGRWLMTGRAGYRVGLPWVARFGGTWAAPDATGHANDARSARGSAATARTGRSGRPPANTATANTGSASGARSASASPAKVGAGPAVSEDASTEPLPASPSAADAEDADTAGT